MAPQVPRRHDFKKPTQPSLGSTTEKTIQKSLRQSKDTEPLLDAASRFFANVDIARTLEEVSESSRKWEAKQERRRNLHFMDRLKEDGEKLRKAVEGNPTMVAFLEVSRSERARCRAEDDCMYAQGNIAMGRMITTDFRIRLEGARTLGFWAPTTHYYHVECFDWMVGVEKLIPKNLKLDGENWGLMVRKWFEHKGRIDLAKLESYIKEHKAFEEEYNKANPNAAPRHMKWWLSGHDDCDRDEAGCSRPLPPMPAGTPILRQYVLEDCGGCNLGEVLRHELMDELPDSFGAVFSCVGHFVPEVEAKDDLCVEGGANAEPTGENEEDVGVEEEKEENFAENK